MELELDCYVNCNKYCLEKGWFYRDVHGFIEYSLQCCHVDANWFGLMMQSSKPFSAKTSHM
jgi:hypothetical protein